MAKPSLINCKVAQPLSYLMSVGNSFDHDADCEFEYNFGREFLPPSMATLENIQKFQYSLFNIRTITSPSILQRWEDYGYDTGLFGDIRRGVGAFFFHDYNLFVDTRGPGGDGTEASPMNYSQLKNYFNPSLGSYFYTHPMDGDDVAIKGIIDLFDPIDGVINLGVFLDGTVTIHAWDMKKNGVWIIDATGIDSSTFNIISNSDGCSISNLIVKDFIFTKPIAL